MTGLKRPVLCIGDICPDIILPYGETRRVMDAIERGETVSGPQKGATVQPGGSVANTAAGLARLGTPVLFGGVAGDDMLGRRLKADLFREGVDARLLHLDPGLSTVLVLVIVEEGGGRVTYALPRKEASHHQLRPEHLPEALPEKISWLHTSGMTLREEPAASAVLAFMARCRQAGIPVSLDINGRIESVGDKGFLRTLRTALEFCTVVMGSGPDELVPLTGKPTPEEAARSLVSPALSVVCRMGAAGATVYTGNRTFFQSAYRVEVADTVGAGDAYNSGFLSSLWRDRSLERANSWGCAAAAGCVAAKGARGCPTLPKLLDILSAGK